MRCFIRGTVTVYLGTADVDFKQRFFNHEGHFTDTKLSRYVWEIKEKFKILPSLKWSIIKPIPAYSNASKKCQLCLQEKFLKFLIILIQMNCIIKGQSLFHTATTLTSFYRRIINLMENAPPDKHNDNSIVK